MLTKNYKYVYNFQRNFEAFWRVFQNEKRSVEPLVQINNKALVEIREEGSKLFEGAVFFKRMNYLTQSQKAFNIEDYIFCLKDFIKRCSNSHQNELFYSNINGKRSYTISFKFEFNWINW